MSITTTSTRKSVYRLMQSLCLYSLEEGSMVYGELESYLVALELLERRIRDFVAGRFILDCSGEALTWWEQLLEMSSQIDDSDEVRRQALISRLSIHEDSFTKAGMLTSIRSAGIEATLEESEEVLTVSGSMYLNTYSGIDEISRTMDLFLPAHISAVLNLGVMTWEMFDEKEIDFDLWNAADFDWEFFDTHGEYIGQ